MNAPRRSSMRSRASPFLTSDEIWGSAPSPTGSHSPSAKSARFETPEPLAPDEMDRSSTATPDSMADSHREETLSILTSSSRGTPSVTLTPPQSPGFMIPGNMYEQDKSAFIVCPPSPINKRVSILATNKSRLSTRQSVVHFGGANIGGPSGREQQQQRIEMQQQQQEEEEKQHRESVAWQICDDRGYKVLQGMDRYGITMEPFIKDEINDEGRSRSRRIKYLEGIRGIIGFQTLLWIFFRIFAPAIVVDRDLDGVYPAVFVSSGPQWMNIIRKIFTPLLFDGSLQMTMFIILTGRVVLLTFLERRQAICLAGPCFRRPLRLLFPVVITLGLVTLFNVSNCFKYTTYMSDHLQNQAAQAPKRFTSALEFFNSLGTFYFAPVTEYDVRAVAFIPPSGISWYLEVVFQQVYVLTIYAWVLPFITLKYKVIGIVGMIALTAWVGRWSWYTLTGLAIAEFSVVYKQMLMPSNPNARRLSVAFLRKNSKIVWVVPIFMTLLGIFFKFFWEDALPKTSPYEIVAHASLNLAGLNHDTNPLTTAYPRYDNWLLCTGLLLLVELSPKAQRTLSWQPLVYLGRLSFSIALLSGTVMLSLGSVIYYCLVEALNVTNVATITGILFFFMIPASLIFAHVFSAVVDDASLFLSRHFFQVSRS